MGVFLVEDVDRLESVDVLGIAPIRNVIACPFDEVLELPVPDLGIKQLFHLLFFFPVDFHWWRQWYDLGGVWLMRHRFQFGDMLHRVHLDIGREIHPAGIWGLAVRIFHDLAGFLRVCSRDSWMVVWTACSWRVNIPGLPGGIVVPLSSAYGPGFGDAVGHRS